MLRRSRLEKITWAGLTIGAFAISLGCTGSGQATGGTPTGSSVSDGITFGKRVHLYPVNTDSLTNKAAPGGAQLQYYGGPVIPNVEVYNVFWNSQVQFQSQLNSFYAAVNNSAYFDWLSEYDTNITPVGGGTGTNQHIGRGSFGGSIVDTGAPAGTTVDDSQIESELQRLINAGSVPSPTANMLYAVYFPPGVSITMQGQGSCQVFCAYHGTFQISGTDVYYAVMPDLGGACAGGCGTGAQFDNTTSASSHEMIEATTDAAVGLATGTAIGPPIAWYDQTNGEIGDICNQQTGTIGGYTVQAEWSNHAGACIVTGSSTTCPTGQTLCGSTCVDTSTDPSNCGACGNACGAGQTCSGGTCTGGGCPTGQTLCGGTCVNTSNDPANCGGCGIACAAGQTCSGGTCSGGGCPTGQTLCGSVCVDTTSDPANCGGCGIACAAGQTCSGGTCTGGGGCPTGQTLCGGVCVDTTSDPANCGGCGIACAAGQTCSGGTCTGGGGGGPSASILSPADGTTLPAYTQMSVSVQATSSAGIASVQLYWAYTGETWSCPSTRAGVTCSSSGSVYTWTLTPGSGGRTFHAVATDNAGQTATTPDETIQLVYGSGGATVTASIASPADGTTYYSGSPFQIVATASSSAAAISSATLNWTSPSGTSNFAMSPDGSGNWTIGGTLGVVGPRTYSVTARDTAGNSATSTTQTLYVQ